MEFFYDCPVESPAHPNEITLKRWGERPSFRVDSNVCIIGFKLIVCLGVASILSNE